MVTTHSFIPEISKDSLHQDRKTWGQLAAFYDFNTTFTIMVWNN